LADRIEEDLIAEHIAVESYADILHYLGGEDRVTRRLFEALLAKARRRLEKLACTRERLLPKAAAISAPET
jgi:bacterioferritin